MAKTVMDRGYHVVSGGTENHLFLMSLIGKGVTGKEAEAVLSEAFITTNKNSVPNDPASPFVTSGLRLGSPAITTRGMKEAEAKDLATWICDILDDISREDVIARVKAQVIALCARFPVYEK